MLYSVFVGHLLPSVTKDELYTLFRGCGDIHDLFIMEDNGKSTYKYGFVRYSTAEEALKAVEELHHWPIRGTKIIVDISKDTKERITEEKKLNNDKVLQSKSSSSVPRPVSRSEEGTKATPLVQDIMYLSRIKETCAGLNCQVSRGLLGDAESRTVNVDRLVDKIAAQKLVKVRPECSDYDSVMTPEQIRDKLLDRKSGSIDTTKALGFIKALQTVVSTMNSFLTEGNLDKDEGPTTENQTRQTPPGNTDVATISGNEARQTLVAENTDGDMITDKEARLTLVAGNTVDAMITGNKAKLETENICSIKELPNIDNICANESAYVKNEDDEANCFMNKQRSEGCLKNDESLKDDSTDSLALKQFFFKPLSSMSDESKNDNGSKISCGKQTSIGFSKNRHIRRENEHVQDNSSTDSEGEGPSRDSGIESDPIYASSMNNEPDSIRTGSNFGSTNDLEPEQTDLIQDESQGYAVAMAQDEIFEGDEEAMDDCDIIKAFMQRALNTTKEANGESQEEAIKEQQRIQEDENAKLSSALDVDDTRCISPSDPVLIGLGRGKISPMCVQPTEQYQGRQSSLSMEASVECEQIQSFLHNALKIGRQEGQGAEGYSRVTSDKCKVSPTPVNIGRGSGRGILQIWKK